MSKSQTPLISIRAFCKWCSNDSAKEIRLCLNVSCPLWSYRHGKNPPSASPLRAIRLKCYDCSGGGTKAIRECDNEGCSIFSYRMGTNPAYSEETKAKMRERSALHGFKRD